MFSKKIISNQLAGNEDAEIFFTQIGGQNYCGDVSFIATLRALVAPRMQEEDSLCVVFNASNLFPSLCMNLSQSDSLNLITSSSFNPTRSGCIYIHNLVRTKEGSNDYQMRAINNEFTKKYDGWCKLEKVTDFYRKQFSVLCFINPTIKSVAIFVDNLTVSRMHYLQCSIFAFLPWYFDPEQGVDSIEMEVINSLREKNESKYNEAIEKIAKRYDFRRQRIQKLLSGFEAKYEQNQRNQISNNIKDIIRRIQDRNTEIGHLLKTKMEQETILMGLEAKIAAAPEESEIMEYFLCNDKLELLSVINTEMLFAVKTYIEYFDEELVDTVIGNKHSYLYSLDVPEGAIGTSEADIEKLMTAIFVDRVLKIRVCAAYSFDLAGAVFPMQDYGFDYRFNTYMPNPHIDGYGCIGNYQMTINELLKNKDYITAIEQCVASAKSLNFGDTCVMRLFSRTIHGINSRYSNTCIELPNGEVVDPNGALKWIKEQEDNRDEQND